MSSDSHDIPSFPATSYQQWLEKAKKDLRDKPFEEILWSHPDLGSIEPFYTKDHSKSADVIPPRSIQGKGNSWQIRQQINNPNSKAQILSALIGGAEAIEIPFENGSELKKQLDQVHTTMIELHFQTNEESVDALVAEVLSLESFQGSIVLDGVFRQLKESQVVHQGRLNSLLQKLTDGFGQHKGVRYAVIEANRVFEAGGSSSQELAYALCAGEHILDAMLANGLTIDEASARVEIRLSAGQSYFETIAKLRVMRTMWAKLIEAYQPENACSAVVWIHAVTSEQHFSQQDAYNNLLRTTTSAMAAICGGCDSLTVSTFDDPNQSEESLRYARNIQHLLREESFLDNVEDASAGSYYVSELTHRLTEKTAECLKEITAQGGLVTAEGSLCFLQMIKASANSLVNAYAEKNKVIVGANSYIKEEAKATKNIAETGTLEALRLPDFETQTESAS